MEVPASALIADHKSLRRKQERKESYNRMPWFPCSSLLLQEAEYCQRLSRHIPNYWSTIEGSLCMSLCLCNVCLWDHETSTLETWQGHDRHPEGRQHEVITFQTNTLILLHQEPSVPLAVPFQLTGGRQQPHWVKEASLRIRLRSARAESLEIRFKYLTLGLVGHRGAGMLILTSGLFPCWKKRIVASSPSRVTNCLFLTPAGS